jgi:hypothetical protein
LRKAYRKEEIGLSSCTLALDEDRMSVLAWMEQAILPQNANYVECTLSSEQAQVALQALQ